MNPKLWLPSGRRRNSYNARIIEATKSDNVTELKRLLENQPKRLWSRSVVQKSLSHAVENRSSGCTRVLLEAGANPNSIKYAGSMMPIPVYVVQEGLTEILEQLLLHGCDVNLPWMNSETILHVAVQQERSDCVRAIMAAGADPTQSNDRDETPLSLAVCSNSVQCLRLMLSHPKAAEYEDRVGRTLLHIAAREGREAILELLLESGFPPNMIDKRSGITPLIEAVLRQHVEIVRCLCSKCDLEFPVKRNMTALLYAAQINSEECLNVLIESGSCVDAQDVMGNSALILAGPYEGVVTALLDSGINTNIQNHFGMTALWYAAFYKYSQIVTKLLRANSHPELKGAMDDAFHTSPLEIALKCGHYGISRQIIYAGCDNHKLAKFMQNADTMPVFQDREEGREQKQWIHRWLCDVRPLRFMARLAIRKTLGQKNVIRRVDQLPLPSLLKNYVNLDELHCI